MIAFHTQKGLVPVDKIKETTPNTIQLNCDLYEYVIMAEFIQSEFIIPDPYGGNQEIPTTMLLPNAMFKGTIAIEHTRVPANELAVHRGTPVIATDGRVGQVGEFLLEPINGHISHLVLREGHLCAKSDISIPVSQIDHIEKDAVYLKINKCRVEALPTLKIHRSGWK